jgi:hypothetical protein
MGGEAEGLRLRRVVPVAHQFSDDTWLVSVEIWDHSVVLQWATFENPQTLVPDRGHWNWLVSDDLGTSYSRSGGGGGNPKGGFHGYLQVRPAAPSEATSLLIRCESTDEELSISLTD